MAKKLSHEDLVKTVLYYENILENVQFVLKICRIELQVNGIEINRNDFYIDESK